MLRAEVHRQLVVGRLVEFAEMLRLAFDQARVWREHRHSTQPELPHSDRAAAAKLLAELGE